ncbi:universal stress protein [Dokdonella immobilis]|uniref:Nucleotide-binding universal stress protein, UspA family n=1 Tax=Dokdonella immobilis TaxID=578942 RepID=A0A1I4VZI6_9GAMM|nr:universal stress protein [Dokdonella immobilis]SFN06748.1 Nucleotide-binding universal stress protein, UspA family [Dokdonella immobilis]
MNEFKKILYVCEEAASQDASILRAVSLAENNQAELTVIDVVPAVSEGFRMRFGGRTSNDPVASMVDASRKRIEALIEPYAERLKIRVDVLVGRTYLEAIRVVLENGHDLLIKPAENPGYIERIFGSQDMQLLRNCPCPVWLTRADEAPKCRNILAAVDLDPDRPDPVEESLNRQILGLAGSLAFSDFATLHVVHVWDAPGESMVRLWANDPAVASSDYVEGVRSSHASAFNLLRQELKARIGEDASAFLSPEFHLRRGVAASVIPELAKHVQADLVVMGTVARTGIAGLLIGNTAEGVFEQLQCSVLAAKPAGFVSPVKLEQAGT